ncbi:MAG: class I SAM-dependent methyltransferase [Anaerolineae bacterium]
MGDAVEVRGEAAGSGLVQVASARHYFSVEYCSPERLASYAYQIREVLGVRPQRVLEIGPGNGLVAHVLRGAGLQVVTLDCDPRLRPDVLGSVLNLPLAARSCDVVLCCEVLEHLPFGQVIPALSEIRRVVRLKAVLTLPNASRYCRALVQGPLLGKRAFVSALPRLRPRPHVFDGQHYWEIGKAGFPMSRIVDAMENAGLEVLQHTRLWECPHQQMFVLAPKSAPSQFES